MVYTDPVPGLWKTVYFPLGAVVSVDMLDEDALVCG